MATLRIPSTSTDCLTGLAIFGAHRGVRAAGARAPRLPMQQQQQRQHEIQTLATASPPHVAMNSRPARGRGNVQQRRRRSPPAAEAGSGSPPHKRVMDNVVILRRGQSIAQAVAEKAEIALAGKDAAAARRGEREKVDESVADAMQSSAEAEKCETAAAVDDQRGAQEAAAETAVATDSIVTETEEEEPVVTTNQSGADRTTEEDEPEATLGHSGEQAEIAEPVAAVDLRGPDSTHEKEAEATEDEDATKAEPAPPAAHLTLPLAKEEDEQAYSGASFAVAPDARALPFPVLLLKPRGSAARIRVHARDNDRAPAATAAAA